MNPLGRSLIFMGVFIAAIGLVVTFAGKIPFIGRLPGDILIKKDHFSLYFPITTCLLISLIVTLLFRFFGHK